MAYGVRSQKFCCCLPVRLGVFVLSFFQFLSWAIVAALCWFCLISKDVHLDSKSKPAVIIFGVWTSLYALYSLLGFLGAIFRKHGFVRIYSISLIWLLAVSVGLGIFAIVTMFRESREEIINHCINGSTNQSVINNCNRWKNSYRYVIIGWFVVGWLFHLYEWIIVSRYVEQLEEEKSEKWRLRSMNAQQGVYSQVPGRASTEALTHPAGASYPYADAKHSFGQGHYNA